MSGSWNGQVLLEPIPGDRPCGQDLEGTLVLSAFDAFSVFGESRRLDGTPERGDTRKLPDWREINEKSLEALTQSKDLRLLAHLAAAVLRNDDGIQAFASTLTTAAHWLDAFWDDVYPRVGEDGFERMAALNCFADRWAIIDALRRAPLVVNRQHGRISLRDLDIVAGQVTAAADENPPDSARVKAAFAEMPLEDLEGLLQSVTAARTAMAAIQKRMLELSDESAPTWDPLSAELTKADRFVRSELVLRTGSETGEAGESSGTQGRVVAIGSIASRDDAVRAMEAVAEFFRRNEPSSPIPLLLDRAKRLVAKNFLDVLADIAPNALEDARVASGLKNTE